jgi:hypothetical protein
MVLLKLGLLTQEQEYSRHAAIVLRVMRDAMSRYPSAFGYTLNALDFYLSEAKEIAIVGELDSHEVRSFVEEAYSRYLPNKVVAACEPDDQATLLAIKLLTGRSAIGGAATAYVCRDHTCLEPSTTVEDFAARLNE